MIAAALVLAVIVPASLAQAAGRGGNGGGGGGGDGGEGSGTRGESPISFMQVDPNCTAGAACRPRVTYIPKGDDCEIRTCEIENGVRKCSVEMTDIKICLTKRS